MSLDAQRTHIKHLIFQNFRWVAMPPMEPFTLAPPQYPTCSYGGDLPLVDASGFPTNMVLLASNGATSLASNAYEVLFSLQTN